MGGSFRVSWGLACPQTAHSCFPWSESPEKPWKSRQGCAAEVWPRHWKPAQMVSLENGLYLNAGWAITGNVPAWHLVDSLYVLTVTILSDFAPAPRLIYPILMRHLYSIIEPSKNMHLLLMGYAVKLINIILRIYLFSMLGSMMHSRAFFLPSGPI